MLLSTWAALELVFVLQCSFKVEVPTILENLVSKKTMSNRSHSWGLRNLTITFVNPFSLSLHHILVFHVSFSCGGQLKKKLGVCLHEDVHPPSAITNVDLIMTCYHAMQCDEAFIWVAWEPLVFSMAVGEDPIFFPTTVISFSTTLPYIYLPQLSHTLILILARRTLPYIWVLYAVC